MTPPTVWTVELVHDAALRRTDVDAHQLVLGRDPALQQFRHLALDFPQFLGNLAAQILVDLDDLQFGLGHLAVGLGGGGDELATFAPEPRPTPAQAGSARMIGTRFFCHRDRTPSSSRRISSISPLLASACSAKPLIFFLELADALPHLRLLSGPRRLAKVEQLLLTVNQPPDVRILQTGRQLGREARLRGQSSRSASRRA